MFSILHICPAYHVIGVLGDDIVIEFDDVSEKGEGLDLGGDEINEDLFAKSLSRKEHLN